MPLAIEGRAYGAALPEAGQPAFGDVLAWFVRTFPRSADMATNFAEYNREASALAPGQNRLVAIDWWNGNRVPYADKSLRGMLAGLDPFDQRGRHLSRAHGQPLFWRAFDCR